MQTFGILSSTLFHANVKRATYTNIYAKRKIVFKCLKSCSTFSAVQITTNNNSNTIMVCHNTIDAIPCMWPRLLKQQKQKHTF